MWCVFSVPNWYTYIYVYILMYILIHLIYHEWSAIGIGNTLHTKKSTSVKCPWNNKFSTRIDFVMHAGPSTLRLETRVFEDVVGRQKRIFRLWKSLNSQVSKIIIMIHDSKFSDYDSDLGKRIFSLFLQFPRSMSLPAPILSQVDFLVALVLLVAGKAPKRRG